MPPTAPPTPGRSAAPRTLVQRVRFVVIGVTLALAVLAVTAPMLAGAMLMLGTTTGTCGGSVDPASDGLTYEEVSFPGFWGGQTAGYFIPGQYADGQPSETDQTGRSSRGTIIMSPTLGSGRGYRQHEYIHYVRAGYDVLTFDSINCAGGSAVNSLGYAEVPQIADALAFLEGRGTAMTRIGLHGFSAGGALSIMAAARYPQISAVVAQGGYHDFTVHLRESTQAIPAYSALFEIGAALTYRLRTGLDMSVLSPVSVIDQIAPRPVLLIYGSTEPSLYGAYAQAAAGGRTVQVWEIPGAGHGDYAIIAPDEYPLRVVGFFDAAFSPVDGFGVFDSAGMPPPAAGS